MASTYDLSAGSDGLFQKQSPDGCLLSKVVDFAKFTGSAAGSATNTADVITIPAGFIVEDVYYKILTASSTASSVFGVGDSGDSVYYMANTMDATATAGTIVKTGAGAASDFHDIATVTALANSLTKDYETASKLVVVLGATAPLNGKVLFIVRGVNTALFS